MPIGAPGRQPRYAVAAERRRAGRYLRLVEPFDPEQRALSVEVVAVRWRAPEGGFAVLAGLTDEGEEVSSSGRSTTCTRASAVAGRAAGSATPSTAGASRSSARRVEEPAERRRRC